MNKIIIFLQIILIVTSYQLNTKSNIIQNEIICGKIPRTKGTCGEECEYIYNHNEQSLNITGKKMDNYKSPLEVPWFLQMENIKYIWLNGIENIGENSFNGAINLNEIIIPESVVTIGRNAFMNCKKLKLVEFKGKDNPCDENNSVFDDIEKTFVFVSENFEGNNFCKLRTSNVYCGINCQWKYNGSTNKLEIYGSGDMINFPKEYLIPWYSKRNNIKTINIEGIKSISSNAFKDCINMEKVIIGSSVESIGINPFIGCSKLKEVIFGSNEYFKYENGMILTKNNKELVTYLQTNNETSFVSPSNELNIIRPSAFCRNNFLQSLLISSTIQIIGENAFSYCENLENIFFMGTNQIKLGNNLFEGSKKVKEIKVKKGYNNIDVEGLTIIEQKEVISGEVNYLIDEKTGFMVFYGKGTMEFHISSTDYSWNKMRNKIRFIEIEKGITTIGSYAFQSCISLMSITIPSSVTTIGSYAFSECTSLMSIAVEPENQKYSSDEYGVLYNKDKTMLIQYPIGNERINYTIHSNVTTIGSYSFKSCISLKSIIVPSNVKTIESSTFESCTSLINIVFEQSSQLITIGNYSFSSCTSLISLTLSSNLTSIGSYTFQHCSSLKIVIFEETSKLTTIGSYSFRSCKSLITIIIQSNVTTIGSGAFESCISLMSITVPSSVTTIGSNVFYKCTSLTNIIVESGNINYFSDEYGVLYNKNKTQLIQYPIGNKRTSYIIPSSVTSIGSSAFYNCTSLTNITIPSSLITIGSYAFQCCSSLTSVIIPSNITSIGSNVFYKCTSLTAITVESDNQKYSSDEY